MRKRKPDIIQTTTLPKALDEFGPGGTGKRRIEIIGMSMIMQPKMAVRNPPSKDLDEYFADSHSEEQNISPLGEFTHWGLSGVPHQAHLARLSFFKRSLSESGSDKWFTLKVSCIRRNIEFLL